MTRGQNMKGVSGSKTENTPEPSTSTTNLNAVSGLVETQEKLETIHEVPMTMPTTVINQLLERFERLLADALKTNKKEGITQTTDEPTQNAAQTDVTSDMIQTPVLPTADSARPLPTNIFNKFYPSKITPRFVEQAIDQLEAWFSISRINDDNERYQLLKLSIEPETYQQVASIINNPPLTHRYNTLKNAIIKTFTDSEAKRIKSLLHDVELGDRRPSQLLSEMSLLYKGPKDRIFKELFISRLPSTVRGILMGMKPTDIENETPLETIAQWADSIMEQLDKKDRMHNVQAISVPNKLENMLDDLSESINALHQRSKFQDQQANRFNPNSRPRPTLRQGNKRPQPTHPTQNSTGGPPPDQRARRDDSIERHTMCWYHRTFGRDAISCKSPCAHPKN